MTAAGNGYRPPTPRELAEDERTIDSIWGRRHCKTHPSQEMIPMGAGLDMCPLPHGEDESAG